MEFSHCTNVKGDARFELAKHLVHAAMDVLERRRIAGTLLRGKCAPHEEEWVRQFLDAGSCDENDAITSVPLVGYNAYLLAARLTLYMFTELYKYLPQTENEPLTPPFMSVVASAADLICEPRPEEIGASGAEAMFVEQVRRCCLDSSWLSRSDREVLRAAWGRLVASGIIERRQLERVFRANASINKEADTKAKADADALGLRSCMHCGAREVHVAQFKFCAACKDKGVLYCSKECQRAAWPAHKAACKAACKAAKGAA